MMHERRFSSLNGNGANCEEGAFSKVCSAQKSTGCGGMVHLSMRHFSSRGDREAVAYQWWKQIVKCNLKVSTRRMVRAVNSMRRHFPSGI